MSIINEQDIINETVLSIAKQMLVAAKTAPKAKGIDNLHYAIVDGDDLIKLADKMIELGNSMPRPGFIRDGENIKKANCIVLLGTTIKSIGLQNACGLCGLINCNEKDKQPNIPCIYNTNDLGIAIGSAVSIATDNRIDNRIMFSIGIVAKKMNLLNAPIIMGIPLSASEKNIFFDRK